MSLQLAFIRWVYCLITLLLSFKQQWTLNICGIISPIYIAWFLMNNFESNLKASPERIIIICLQIQFAIVLHLEFLSHKLLQIVIYCGCQTYFLIPKMKNTTINNSLIFSLLFLLFNSLTYLIIAFIRENNQQKYFFNYQRQLNQIEIWKHIIHDVFPGITALINVKNCPEQGNNSYRKYSNANRSLSLQQDKWELLQISKQGESQYGVRDNTTFISFLLSISISASLNENLVNLQCGHSSNITLFDILNAQVDLDIMSKQFETEDTLDVVKLKGIREESCEKFNILLCKFNWNNKLQYFFKLENISIENQLAELKELNEAKNKIMSNITHDLKNPLNIVMELIKNSVDCKDTAKRNEMLQFAYINSELLMSLIYDILDNAQLQENKIKINFEQFNLINTLQSIINLMKVQAKLKKIALEFINLLDHKDYQIKSDGKRLKQILINIIGNAIKFTKTGFIKLIVSQSQNHLIKFEVIDTGTGIKQEIIPQLTQAFATFGNEFQANISGVGLGLNFCKEIIGLLGPVAKIHISSVYGKGSKFGFVIYNHNKILKKYSSEIEQYCEEEQDKNQNLDGSLNEIFSQFNPDGQIAENFEVNEFSQDFDIPKENFEKYQHQEKALYLSIEQPENNIQISGELMQPIDLQLIMNLNVLLVDDCAFNILILRKQLEKLKGISCICFEAFNGQEAVEIFRNRNKCFSEEGNIKLILMDCNMPLKNGYDASFEIKTLVEQHQYQDAIIFALTAYSGEDETQKCLSHKMNFVLQKPVTSDTLQKVINDYFKLLNI